MNEPNIMELCEHGYYADCCPKCQEEGKLVHSTNVVTVPSATEPSYQSTSAPLKNCPYCGPSVFHSGVCPRIKSIAYYPDGSVRGVWFK